MCIGGTYLHNSNKTMSKELTLDQLQSFTGAKRKLYNQEIQQAKGAREELKELADSGQLFQQVKYIPSEMYRIVPGDMF